MEAWRLKMKPWRFYRPVVIEFCHFDDEGKKLDPDLDLHISEKLDPDPDLHLSENLDPNPHLWIGK
jgi:hypothetical protein